ncbi:MAG TPA: calcium-binding protein [Microvirga sp.]|nr:calcium-binding protein [Microvirga sp.]
MANVTVAEYRAARAAGTPFPDDVNTLVDTGENISGLSQEEVSDLAGLNVDSIDATNDALILSIDQFVSLGTVTLTQADVVTFRDTGADLATGSPGQISALAGAGIDIMEASDGALTFTLDQFLALGAVVFSQATVATVTATSADFASGTPAQVAELATKNVDFIDATDDVLTYSLEQLNALGTVSFVAGDLVTVTGTGAQFGALTPGEIAAIGAKNVDVLDASDNAVTLTAAQAAALTTGGTGFAADDAVTLADAGAALSGLTPGQIAALSGKGVDALNATDNVLSLSLAQFNALGSVGLTADDAIKLTDVGAALSGLTPDQLAGLAGRGIDSLDASDNALTFSVAQYQAVASLAIAAEDSVRINGTNFSERIDGRASNETIKGFGGNDNLFGGDGNDWLWGGTGKDVMTGGAGRDAFVFDTRPNKKTNYDTIRDFNVRDDTIYLDNAVFKKLGKGSETKPGKLNKSFFEVDNRADDRNDYLIYNKKTGVLYYDADGSGAGRQVEIAKLSKNLKLKADDFLII